MGVGGWIFGDDEQFLFIKGAARFFLSQKYYFNANLTCDNFAQIRTTTVTVRKLLIRVCFGAEFGEIFNMKVVALGLSFPAI